MRFDDSTGGCHVARRATQENKELCRRSHEWKVSGKLKHPPEVFVNRFDSEQSGLLRIELLRFEQECRRSDILFDWIFADCLTRVIANCKQMDT